MMVNASILPYLKDSFLAQRLSIVFADGYLHYPVLRQLARDEANIYLAAIRVALENSYIDYLFSLCSCVCGRSLQRGLR